MLRKLRLRQKNSSLVKKKTTCILENLICKLQILSIIIKSSAKYIQNVKSLIKK